jgi:hypothetical protein
MFGLRKTPKVFLEIKCAILGVLLWVSPFSILILVMLTYGETPASPQDIIDYNLILLTVNN